MRFVITDPATSDNELPGFAKNDPIEGWIFTVLLSAATRFETEAEAIDAVRKHYRGRSHNLVVTPLSK